jgi:hypothetical protein
MKFVGAARGMILPEMDDCIRCRSFRRALERISVILRMSGCPDLIEGVPAEVERLVRRKDSQYFAYRPACHHFATCYGVDYEIITDERAPTCQDCGVKWWKVPQGAPR